MSKKGQKALASATVMSLVLSTVAVMPVKAAVTTDPAVAGAGRVETSIAIAEKAYTTWTDSTTAVIANGADAHLVDSLAVAPLAYQKKAPILLTLGTDKVEQSVIDELAKHSSVKNVYLVGAVPASAKAQLEAAGYTVTVLQGTSRYETAAAINKELGSYSKVAVVSGTGLADALSIASIAAKDGMAIELTDNNKNVPTDLDGKTAYTIGGTGVVAKDYGTRLAGANRLATNAAVVDAFKADLDFTKIYVANSANNHLVDALAGSVLAAQSSSPIVLVDETANDDLEKVLTEKKSAVKNVIPLGGQVSTSALGEITAAIDGTSGNASDIKADSLDTVKAIANNKVEVTVNDGVTPDSNASDYTIVEKGTTTALKVSDAVLEGTKVVLTTDAMTAGKAYTLTVGAAKVNFAGIAKVTAAPAISTVVCKDTNKVKVTFDKVVDKETAETVANYTLNNSATVKSATINSDRNAVTLITDGVANNKLYTLKVTDVKNSDGIAMKSASKTFVGKTDTTAAKLASISVKTNNRIVLSFTDDHGVDKTSAETLANYAISTGTEDLKVISATAIQNDDTGYYDKVELVTDTQEANKSYTLTINNLVDGSTSANKISKALTMKFRGKSTDKSAPTVVSGVTVLTPTKIEVKFSDSSALDPATATDPANYVFNNDLTAEKVEIKDDSDMYEDAGKTVVITTSAQETKGYTLTIKGVGDEFGNTITTGKVLHFQGEASDNVPPYVKSVKSTSDTEVVLTFDSRLNEATAEDPTNYVLNNDMGAALEADYDEDANTVTLTTAGQTTNTSYTITINGVEDLSGNAMTNAKVGFISTKTSSDVTAPTVNYAVAFNKDELRVNFDEAVKYASSTLTAKDSDGTSTLSFEAVATTDDDATVIYKLTSGSMDDNKTYTIDTLTNVRDKSNNLYILTSDDDIQFSGSEETNDGPEVESVDQVDARTFKVYFDEDIKTAATGTGKLGNTVKTLDFAVDDDDDAVLDVTLDGNAIFTGDINVDFTSYVTDLVGTGKAYDLDDTAVNDTTHTTTLEKVIEDTDKPEISEVYSSNKSTVKVQYNESIYTAGTYKLTYEDENGNTKNVTVSGADVDSSDDTIVDVTVGGNGLDSDYNYTITPLTGSIDIAGNRADVKDVSFVFPGSDVNPTAVDIKGVAIIDGENIEVTRATAYSVTPGAVSVYELDGSTTIGDNLMSTTGTAIKADTYDKVYSVALNAPVLADTSYKVTIGTSSYTFTGIVEDNGITVEKKSGNYSITFNGMDTDNYVVEYFNLTSDGITGSAVSTTKGTNEYTPDVAPTSDKVLVVVKGSDGTVKYASKVDVVTAD